MEEKQELFQSTLDIIKQYAGSQNYTIVEAELNAYKAKNWSALDSTM